MITTIYRVEVEIPDKVWAMFGHTSTYDRMGAAATEGNVSAGSNRYSEVYEWAEYHSIFEAEDCELRLNNMVEFFKAAL